MGGFNDYVHELGDMHDCRVRKISIDLVASSMTLQIDDLYSNFEGLPEYPGLTPAIIFLDQIELFSADFSSALGEVCGISEFKVAKETEDSVSAEISFWPYGKIHISFRSARIASGTTALWPRGKA